MNRASATFLLTCLVYSAFPQFLWCVDTALWSCPISPKQVVANNIKTLITKSSWTSRNWCESPKSVSLTVRYDFDVMGSPTHIFMGGTEEGAVYVCKNDYQKNHLVRSQLFGKDKDTSNSFTQHFNASHLCDTTSLVANGEHQYQMVYHFDSLSRLVQTDTYKRLDSSLKLTLRDYVFYGEQNRPERYVKVQGWQNPYRDSVIRIVKTSRGLGSEKRIEYEYGLNHEKIRVLKTVYRRNTVKVIRNVPYRRWSHGGKVWVVEKKFKRSGIIHNNSYVWRWFLTPHRFVKAKQQLDAASGLPIKNVVFPAKSAVFPKGMQREVITVYEYLKTDKQP